MTAFALADGVHGLTPSVGDLPDVPAGIAEAGRADAPRSVDRAAQEVDAAPGELLARRVDVLHPERELEAHAGIRRRDGRRLDELRRLAGPQQVAIPRGSPG